MTIAQDESTCWYNTCEFRKTKIIASKLIFTQNYIGWSVSQVIFDLNWKLKTDMKILCFTQLINCIEQGWPDFFVQGPYLKNNFEWGPHLTANHCHM